MAKVNFINVLVFLFFTNIYCYEYYENPDSLKIITLESQIQKLNIDLNQLKSSNKILKDSLFEQNKNFIDKNYFDVALDSLSEINAQNLKLIDSLISLIEYNSDLISIERNNIKILEGDIIDVSDNLTKSNNLIEENSNKSEFNDNQISQISKDFNISKNNVKTLIIIIFSIILILLFFVLVKNKSQNNKLKKIFENQLADSQKIVDWLSIDTDEKLNTQSSEADPDHSFAKKLASEINRISYNLSLMDDSVRGHRQLSSSVKRLKITLNNNDYEMVELLGKKYDPGMNLSANFVTDSTLEKGESIITKIIKPQINFKGKMIQSAEVEVSINE